MALSGIIGHYEILEILGSGAMGDVYKARDLNLPRVVALKVLSDRLSRTEEARKRFDGEVNSATELSHENIVTIYDRGEHDGRPWFAMEFIDGADLYAIIRSAEPRSQERNLDLAIQICDALHSAHARGIIHRDLKPANVMVKTGGNREIAKLVDFGIVHREDQKLTQADTQPGTLSYMSPEQVNGEPIDWRSDLFSLGIVLYELFTGAHPFEAASEFRIAERIRRDEPVSMKKKRADISGTLDAVVLKLLEKDRTQRPQTAAEVAQQLRDLHRRLTGSGTSGGIVASTADEFIRASVEQMISEGRKREGDGFADEALQWYRRAQDLDSGNERIQKRIREVLYRIESDKQFADNIEKSREALAAGAVEDAQKFCNAAFVIRKESEDVAALQAEIDRARRGQPPVAPAPKPAPLTLDGVAPPEDDGSRAVVDREIAEATQRLEAGDPAGARTILVRLVARYPDYPLVEHMLDMVVQVEERGIDVKTFHAARKEAMEALRGGRLAAARSAAARALQTWPDNEEVLSISREIDTRSRKTVTDLLIEAERLVAEASAVGAGMSGSLTKIRTAMDKASEAEALGGDPQTVRRIFDEARRLHDVLYKKEQLVQGLLSRGRREAEEAAALGARADQEMEAVEAFETARETFDRVLQEDEANAEAAAARQAIDRQVADLEARVRERQAREAEQGAVLDAVRRRLDAVRTSEARTHDEVGLAESAIDAAEEDLARVGPDGPQAVEIRRLREDAATLRARLADRREALRHREQTIRAHLEQGRAVLTEIRHGLQSGTPQELERIESLSRDAESAFGLVLGAEPDHAEAKEGAAEARSAAEHARDDLRRSREAVRERDRLVAERLREAAEHLSRADRQASETDPAALKQVEVTVAEARAAFEAVAALEPGHDAVTRGLESCDAVIARARAGIEAADRKAREETERQERDDADRRARRARLDEAASEAERALEGARRAVEADDTPSLGDAAEAIANAARLWGAVRDLDGTHARVPEAVAELDRLEASRRRLAEERSAPPPPPPAPRPVEAPAPAAKPVPPPKPARKPIAEPPPPPPAPAAPTGEAPSAKEIKTAIRKSRELENGGKLREAVELLETMERRATGAAGLEEGVQDLRIRIEQVRAKLPAEGGSKKGLLIGGGIAVVAVVAIVGFLMTRGGSTTAVKPPVAPPPPASRVEPKPEPEPEPPKREPFPPVATPTVTPSKPPAPAPEVPASKVASSPERPVTRPEPKPVPEPAPVRPTVPSKIEATPKPTPTEAAAPVVPPSPAPALERVGFEGTVLDSTGKPVGANWKLVFLDIYQGASREVESQPTAADGSYFLPLEPGHAAQAVRAIGPSGERVSIPAARKVTLPGKKVQKLSVQLESAAR